MEQALKYKALHSIKWRVGLDIAQKVIFFLASIIVARRLGPEAYGVFAFALVVIGSFEVFKTLGFDSALIRMEKDVAKATDTAFIIIPLSGIILYLLLFALAPFLAHSFHAPELKAVLRILGLVFVFSCFAKVSATLLVKKMQFKKIALAEFCGALAFSVISVLCALSGFGVWALVYGYVTKVVIYSFLVSLFAKWTPKFQFDPKIARDMFHFGKFVFLGVFVWFLRKNLDNFLVGKLIGMTALGLYALSFNLSNFLSDYLSGHISTVMYPAFSKLQNDPHSLKKAFFKTAKMLSMIVLPFGVLLFSLGGDIVKIVYGERWIEAIPVIRILALGGIFNALQPVFTPFFLAVGKPKNNFYISLIQVILFFTLITPMASLYGIVGVAIVVSVASLLGFLVCLFLLAKELNWTIKEAGDFLKTTVLASVFMLMTILIIKEFKYCFVFQGVNSLNLILCLLIGTGAYFLVLRCFDRLSIQEVWNLIGFARKNKKI